MNKAESIATMVQELFHSKGRNFPKEALKTWTRLLLPFETEDLREAFFKMILSSESFPNTGMIIDMVTGNTNKDARVIWTFFEDYCESIVDFRHSNNEFDARTVDIYRSAIECDMSAIELVCTKNKYIDADKTQKEIWKNQFLKSYSKGTDKIENYLLQNNSKLLEEK